MLDRLARTDLLIDATRRIDPSLPVIPQRVGGDAPRRCGDPRPLERPVPPGGRSADGEGHRRHPAGRPRPVGLPRRRPRLGSAGLPVDTTHRRTALSCYAWPGIHPRRLHGGLREPDRAADDARPDHADRGVGRSGTARTTMRAAARGELLARWRTTMADVTVGFPRMRKEPGERRDFLPPSWSQARPARRRDRGRARHRLRHGLPTTTTRRSDPHVPSRSHEDAFEQDVVVVLRCPERRGTRRSLPSGTALVSMLHFPTRPERVARLRRPGRRRDRAGLHRRRRRRSAGRGQPGGGVERARGRVRRARAAPIRGSRPGPPTDPRHGHGGGSDRASRGGGRHEVRTDGPGGATSSPPASPGSRWSRSAAT